MPDSINRIQEHLGVALQKLSAFELRVTAGQDPAREAARCLADLQRVAKELNEAFDAVKHERQRLADVAQDAHAMLRRTRTLFEESPSACVVVRRGCALIEDANAAASRLLNVSHRHLIGKPFTNFLQQDREFFLQQLQRSPDGAASQWQVSVRPRERAPVRLRVNAIVESEATAALVLFPSVNDTSMEQGVSKYA